MKNTNKMPTRLPVTLLAASLSAILTVTPAGADTIITNVVNTNQSGNVAVAVNWLSGDASGGTIRVENGGIIDRVIGGATYDGNVINNTVIVSGGTVNQDALGGITEKGDAIENTLTITGGTIDIAEAGYTDNGSADINTVNMSGGTVGQLGGGYAKTGIVSGNTVTITGGRVTNNISAGDTVSGTVTGNTTNIEGGNLEGALLYGYYVWKDADGNPGSGSGSNNTINIKFAEQTQQNDIRNLGNIFNMTNNNLFFYLPNTVTPGQVVMGVGMSNHDDTQLTWTNLGVCIAPGANLKMGHQVVVLNAANLVIDQFPINQIDKMDKTACDAGYEFTLSAPAGENKVIATVTKVPDGQTMPKRLFEDSFESKPQLL